MPYFITESSTQKAISFWLIARLTEAVFIVIVLLLPKRRMVKDHRPLLLFTALAYVTTFTIIIFAFEHSLPLWVIEGEGSTPIKNGIEYVISFFHLMAIVIALSHYRKTKNPAELSIALAFFFLLICNFIFTMYVSVHDFDNFLGHIYKVVGYFYILRGFYFSAINEPFSRNKIINDKLNMTQQQFQAMLTHTADGIVLLNIYGKIIHVNPAFEKIFEYKSHEVVGKLIPIVPEDRMGEAHDLFRTIESGESITDFETERVSKSGKRIPVSLTISPIKDRNGEVMFFSSIIRDISQRKHTEEYMIKSEKLSVIGQLAAGFAHEIRNPLTTIKGFMYLIEKEMGNNKKLYFDLINSELNRIELITNEFMSVAKPQAVKYEEKNIVDLVEEVTTFMEPQALLHNVQINIDVKDEIPLIVCEGNQLKQVFINLLKNAMEAMPNGGDIYISINSTSEKSISISIKDEGCGIPEDVLSKLGEPFYSLKEKGTGLGLMVCYKIINEHNGNITIDTKVNEGTTFIVTLPIATSSNVSE
ncbi:MAG: PAS domain S-box protein [Bacillus sp. (in: Bacteria)]|nr:PAS domain S-box protein [Bacillus sp. (in: firmicutes)]